MNNFRAFFFCMNLFSVLVLSFSQSLSSKGVNGAKACVIAADTDDESSKASIFQVCHLPSVVVGSCMTGLGVWLSNF